MSARLSIETPSGIVTFTTPVAVVYEDQVPIFISQPPAGIPARGIVASFTKITSGKDRSGKDAITAIS